MDYRIFNVHTDVNVYGLHTGVYGHLKSALKVDSGRKIPCCIRELNLPQQHAGLMLYQLHDIPTPIDL